LISIATADSLLPDVKQEQFFNTGEAKKNAAKKIRRNNARDDNAQALDPLSFQQSRRTQCHLQSKVPRNKDEERIAFWNSKCEENGSESQR
jgi:hypothetical protein